MSRVTRAVQGWMPLIMLAFLAVGVTQLCVELGISLSSVVQFLQRLAPAAAGDLRRTSLCVYTRSPDLHFLLGPHPEAPQIILASPCSGHGFKFASLFGDILADLATAGSTAWPIGLFQPARAFAL